MPDFIETILNLERDWPEERLLNFILDELRDACKWVVDKKKEIELENNDARKRGVSYSERKKYSTQIEALDSLFKKWRSRGIEYKTTVPKVWDFSKGEYDVVLIHSLGFEWQVKSMILM